ncbi:MAG: family phosphoesterase [Chlamydiales bacterium]|jgi:membrane-associated phospholipid phosphatase|nr:family phosphoesterase [Chlamydiales bacterium]
MLTIERAGDLIQIAIPLSAFAYACVKQDYIGGGKLAALMIVNQVALEILKKCIPTIRPNGGHGSFPSGHTAAAMVGAGFMIRRYSLKEGILPLALASYVAFSRVFAKAHWVRDVIGGAALGLGLCLSIEQLA